MPRYKDSPEVRTSKTGTEREIAGIARADGGRGCPRPEIRI